uniref:Uncharacterized protein n=1 Tax=Peronospora matthiolae TaxID=2874970 RepID=A0AAV1TP82_9STRA
MYRPLLRRRWSSSVKSTTTSSRSSLRPAHTTVHVSPQSLTPGTVRVTKGYGATKHEAELDSTLVRLVGSDWGDRSHQSVSLPMRLYWIVFALVLGNGVYTFTAERDESFLLDKVKKKLDETWGVHDDENECEDRAEEVVVDTEAASTAPSMYTVPGAVKQETELSMGTSLSRGMPTPSFFVPGISKLTTARRSLTKEELEQQLVQLRGQQERLQKEIRSGEGAGTTEEAAHQVRMLEMKKEQVKLMMRRL